MRRDVMCAVVSAMVCASAATAEEFRIVSLDETPTPEPGLVVTDHTAYGGPVLGLSGASCQATLVFPGMSGSRQAVVFGDGIAPFEIAMRTREGEMGGMDPVGEYIHSLDPEAPLTTDSGLVGAIARIENAPDFFRPAALLIHDALTGARVEVMRRGDIPVNDTLEVDVQTGNDTFSINGAGLAAAFVELGFDEQLEAIVSGDGSPGSLRVVAKEGDAADGSGAFDDFFPPAINDAGTIAFAAELQGAAGAFVFPWAVYREVGGTLEEVTREGALDPFGLVITDLGFTTPSLNAGGATAYWARVDLGVDGMRVSLVYAPASGAHTRLVISGDSVPGVEGALFRLVSGRTYAINDAGQVAFKGQVNLNPDGALDTVNGVFRADGAGGAMLTVALERDPAPGGGTLRTISDYALNASGQIAFEATVDMPDGSTPRAVFFYDDDEGLREIVREGDVILGGVIEFLEFSGADVGVRVDGVRSGLNDNGEVAFWFRLDSSEGISDREGVAVWPAGAVSCPADLDGDGSVGAGDLAALLASWGQGGTGDLDSSGETDAADLAALLAAWGACPG